MLTLLSMLCACCVANPQAVVKTQSLTCGDADDTKAFVSKGQVCTVRIGSDTLNVGCCKSAREAPCCAGIHGKGVGAGCCQSAKGACCSPGGPTCGVVGAQGAVKIIGIPAKPGCGVAIGGGASGAGCCQSAKSACCSPGGPICGVVGGQGARKIMRISAKPGGAVGIWIPYLLNVSQGR